MKNKKTIAIITVAILLVLGGAGFWYKKYYHKNFPVVQSGPTPAQQKQQADVYASEKKQAVENPPATQTTTPAPVPTSNISLSTRQESNGTVTVFTKLAGVSDGTCVLNVTNGSKSTSQTADVIYQPQYSSCAGFSVPISSVGTGTWTLKLSLTTHGTTSSNTITQEIK